jgi:ABC-type transport system involved in cytochrome c biogenesis permease component
MIKKFYQEFEQVILFFSLIAYMTTFSILFDYELRTTSWAGILWVVQFFGFATLLGLYGRKRGWKWPERY